jgi:hypothetical protein
MQCNFIIAIGLVDEKLAKLLKCVDCAWHRGLDLFTNSHSSKCEENIAIDHDNVEGSDGFTLLYQLVRFDTAQCFLSWAFTNKKQTYPGFERLHSIFHRLVQTVFGKHRQNGRFVRIACGLLEQPINILTISISVSFELS